MLRSVIAIVAGFVFIAVLSTGTGFALEAALPEVFGVDGRAERPFALLFMQGYVAVIAIAGCYLAARLAPRDPMKHALILGGLGLVMNIAGSAAFWEAAPAWYHVLAIALVMPYAWLGGRIRERQLVQGGATPVYDV